MSIKRVHWTEHEEKSVLDKAWVIFKQKKLSIPFGRGVLKNLVQEAQEAVLPKERWRNTNQIQHYQFVELDIMDRLTSPESERPVEVQVRKDVVAEVLSKQGELEDLIADNIAQLFLESDVGKRLVAKVSERIRQRVMEAVKVPEAPTQQVTIMMVEDVSVAKPPEKAGAQVSLDVQVAPKKLRKIGVAGGDSRLFRMLQDEFDGVLDLRCFDSDHLKRSGAAVSRFSGVEMVLLCTDYLSHPSYHNVKNSIERWHPVSGRGPDKIIDKLYEICHIPKEKAGAA